MARCSHSRVPSRDVHVIKAYPYALMEAWSNIIIEK
jgi:hypothetical protein